MHTDGKDLEKRIFIEDKFVPQISYIPVSIWLKLIGDSKTKMFFVVT